MPYIYKYVNKETEDVEYVGISNNDISLIKRFKAHEKDVWWSPFKYDIYYALVSSKTDAECLEGHFIALYKSYLFHNKAKSGWGICSFAADVKWERYDQESLIQKKGYDGLTERFKHLYSLQLALNSHIEDIQVETDALKSQIFEWKKDGERLRRASVRQWFRETLQLVFYPNKGKSATDTVLYDMYCDYYENLDRNRYYTDRLISGELYDFDDINEFWETLLDIPEYFAAVRGNTMYSILTREEYEETIHKSSLKKIADVLESQYIYAKEEI